MSDSLVLETAYNERFVLERVHSDCLVLETVPCERIALKHDTVSYRLVQEAVTRRVTVLS